MRESWMRVSGFLLAGLAGLTAAAFAAAPPGSTPPQDGQRFAQPGVVVVKFLGHPGNLAGSSKTGLPGVDEVLTKHGARTLEPLDSSQRAARKPGGTDLGRIFFARYDDGQEPAKVAYELAGLQGVEYAEPLWAYPLAATPDDPSFAQQVSALGHMGFTNAWDTTKGEMGTVVIAVVDGGTSWTHNDLVANIWSNPGETLNGVDDDGNGYVDDVRGWNFGNSTNDPTGLPSTPQSGSHGTHTAGIACAATNNALQVAGASWNAKLMPINAALADADRVIGWGYPGIKYAAENGADVISLSWGGTGNPSVFEQEIIQFAWEQGVAICAAAGNNSGNADDHFPSAYDHVLSVANVELSDVRAGLSNVGYTVDVSAHGQQILSTIPVNSTGLSSGTSMSTPFVAGACALVKTRWPGYTVDQVMQRVRVTSDNINPVNPEFPGQLGFGRLNASKALTMKTPAIRLTDIQIRDQDGDGVIEAGENVAVDLEVTNLLAVAQSVSFTLTETSQFVTVTNPTRNVATIDSLQSVQLATYNLTIAANAQANHTVNLALNFTSTSPSYTDVDRFKFVVQPLFLTHGANNIQTTVTSTGRLGYAVALGGNGQDGVGFSYAGGPNILFEAAMLMGTSAGKLVDAARNVTGLESNFGTPAGGTPKMLPPDLADEQSVATFSDGAAPTTIRVHINVRQNVYLYALPPNDDSIILRYRIRNDSGAPISGLRVGWFEDWDIGDSGAADAAGGDRTGYDASRGLGYMWDQTGSAGGVVVGTLVLTPPGTTAFRGIWNDDQNPSNPSFGVYTRNGGCSACDGYSKAEKWLTLTEGIVHTEAGPEDVSIGIATGPFGIATSDSLMVAFAFVAGNDLADLQANADAVIAKWNVLGPLTPVTVYAIEAAVEGADVVVRWQTTDARDVAGYRIFRSRDGGALEALGPDVARNSERRYDFRDGAPAPGHYFYRVGEVTSTGAVVLHGGVEVEVAAVAPGRSYLSGGTPNPFNPVTTLRYGLAAPGPVRLLVYDARGRQVRTLVQKPYSPAGTYSATWDGVDDGGRSMPSGIYLVRLQTLEQMFTRRVTLLK